MRILPGGFSETQKGRFLLCKKNEIKSEYERNVALDFWSLATEGTQEPSTRLAASARMGMTVVGRGLQKRDTR